MEYVTKFEISACVSSIQNRNSVVVRIPFSSPLDINDLVSCSVCFAVP